MAIDLHYLKLFHAVAEAGSITAGAEQMATSQPAVSRQLARLERNLGVRLVDRLPRGVSLTQAGETLLGYARRIFAVEKEAREVIAELRGLRSGRLHLGASLTIGSYLLPQVLAEYRRRFPRIQVEVEIANTREIHARLLGGQLDLALTEGLVDTNDLEAVPFSQDELIAVAPPGHPILKLRQVTLRRVCGEALIFREAGSGTRAIIEHALAKHGQHTKPALVLGSSEAIKGAVQCGLGLAIISRLAVRNEIAAGTLTQIRISDLTLMRSLYRVGVKGRSLSPAAVGIWHLLQDKDQGPKKKHGSNLL